jgi:HSP20 family molecular chaperone IbpA
VKRRALQHGSPDAKLLAKTNRLAYDAGLVSENLMRLLLSLDSVGVGLGGQVRQVRRAEVIRIKETMKEYDQLRKRVLQFVPRLHARLPVIAETAVVTTAPSDTSSAGECSSVTDPDSDSAMEVEHEDQEDQQDQQESQLPSQDIAAEQSLDPARRYQLRFSEQRVRGGVLLSAAVPGVDADDVDVSIDAATRTLTIKGIRYLLVRSWMQQPTQDYRWFEQQFTLPASLDVRAEKMQLQVAGGRLQILLPTTPPRDVKKSMSRFAESRARTARPAIAMRHPQSQYDRVYDRARAQTRGYSHPWARRPALHPFRHSFGSGFSGSSPFGLAW